MVNGDVQVCVDTEVDQNELNRSDLMYDGGARARFNQPG